MEEPNLESIDSISSYLRQLADGRFYGSITITFTSGVVVLAKVEQTFKSNKVQTVISNRDHKSGANNANTTTK